MTEDENAGARLQRWRERGARLVRDILDRPMRGLVPLLLLALGIELGQYWTELFPGGHAIGEFVRNLAYALIGALIFNWLIVEIPARRRRRAAYEYHKLDFETLLGLGPACIAQYRHFNPPGAPVLDSWDKKSVWECAKRTAEHQPLHFAPQRAQLLAVSFQGVQMTLDGMKSSTFFFDPDVAHALALFPGTVGVRQLQVTQDNNGFIPWQRDAHIVWELLEASRRLYPALRRHVPDISFSIGLMTLGDGTNLFSQESDLLPPAKPS